MSSNEQLIQIRYSNKKEDKRAFYSRTAGLEFHYTKKVLENFIDKQSQIIEIGCGTGYYGLYFSQKCKEYTGIDLVPENIEVFNQKIADSKITNIITMVGDATKLINIKNNEYDIVLSLGPMYHLPPNERDLAFIEAKRICKENGIVVFAYQNKLGAYLQSGILSNPNLYPNEKANEYILVKETDEESPGLFYFTTPEEIAERAKLHGFSVIKNIGINYFFNSEQINNMDEEKFRCWLEFSDYLCESESCTGLSVHALLICKN